MNQLGILINAFTRGEHLTVATALTQYGIYALSQRCGELRKQGLPIASKTVKLTSGKKVSEYWWDFDKEPIAYG